MVLLQATFSFGNAIDYLVDLGVYDFFLPFLLVFAIIFAILEKTKVLASAGILDAGPLKIKRRWKRIYFKLPHWLRRKIRFYREICLKIGKNTGRNEK